MFSHVVNATNIGMRDAAGNLHLTLKSFQKLGIAGILACNNFDRDSLSKRTIVGFQDFTHSSSSEYPENLEAGGDYFSGAKWAVRRAFGRTENGSDGTEE